MATRCIARVVVIPLLVAFWSMSHASGSSYIPLFTDGSNPMQQSFVRLVNLEEYPIDLQVRARDDRGNELGPVTFHLDGYSTRHFNSRELQDRLPEGSNSSGGIGNLRLWIKNSSDSGRFQAQGYMRSQDGFVTTMQDVPLYRCPHPYEDEDCSRSVRFIPMFNPASNRNQQSQLRLTNESLQPAEVSIVGVDAHGKSPGTEVRLTVDPQTSRTLTALELEQGATGLAGQLGDGEGKWRLEIHGDYLSSVMSLLESPTGHLVNLDSDDSRAVNLFRDAFHPTQQSFARLINFRGITATVEIRAYNDAGLAGTFSLEVPAYGTRHFNSNEVAEWLGVGDDRGDLRLHLGRVNGGYSQRGIEMYAYIRTKDGFLTPVIETVKREEGLGGDHEYEGNPYHYVPFFNPGRNGAQRSQLRLVNHNGYPPGLVNNSPPANIRIIAVDALGVSRGGVVRVSLPIGTSRTLTAEELETGGEGIDGYLGEGHGKWRLYIYYEDPEQRIEVMNLLESPTGHLSNLSDSFWFFDLLAPVPPPIHDANLRSLVAKALGKPSDAPVYRSELAELINLYVPPDAGIESWMGLQSAVNLERLHVDQGTDGSLPLAGLKALRYLDIGRSAFLSGRVTNLSKIAPLPNLEELYCVCELSDLSPLRGFPNLLELSWLFFPEGDVTDLAALGSLKNLRRLSALNVPAASLSVLSGLTKLEQLALEIAHDGRKGLLKPLAELVDLQLLSLRGRGIGRGSARGWTWTDNTAILNPRLDLSPLSGLSDLQELEIENFFVASLEPLGELSHLTRLKLSRTRASDLTPLIWLKELESLFLSQNQITSLSPLSGMTGLISLVVSRNHISDLSPLTRMTKLLHLDISGNRITDISPLSGMEYLRTLVASANRIDDLSPLKGLAHLRNLDVGSNRIHDLSPLAKLSGLTTLFVANNQVADLTPLVGLTALRHLDLEGNAITDLSPLLDNSGLNQDTMIHLSYNLLGDQSRNTIIPSLEQRGVQVTYTAAAADQDEFPLATTLTKTYDDRVLVANWRWPWMRSEEKLERCPNAIGRSQCKNALFREFYTYFEDEFDFLVLFYTTRTPVSIDRGIAGSYESVSNRVLGISKSLHYDRSAGSAGRLKGVVNVYAPPVRVFHEYHPGSGPHDTLSHEIMHAWGAGLFPTSEALDPQPPSHWGASNFLGVLGGFDPDPEILTHIGGIRYWVRIGNRVDEPLLDRYAPLEMYLAGFYAPEDVPSFWTAPFAEVVLDEDGLPVLAPDGRRWIVDAHGKRDYTIDDLISIYGPRVPNSSEAQWHFRAAAIVVDNPHGKVSDEDLKGVSDFLKSYSRQVIDDDAADWGRREGYTVGFYQMTGGRGTIAFDGLSRFRKPIPAAPVNLPDSFGTPPGVQYCKDPYHIGGVGRYEFPLGWDHTAQIPASSREQ